MTRPVTLLVGSQYKAGDVLEFQGSLYTAKEDSTYIDAETQRFAEEVNDQHLMTGWHTQIRPATEQEVEAYKSEQRQAAEAKQAAIAATGNAYPVGTKVRQIKGRVGRMGTITGLNKEVPNNIQIKFDDGQSLWIGTNVLEVV